jgi:uncharacterized membrane protein YdbT with pleckstrin-like domain
MAEVIIRPTMKFIYLGYILSLAVAAGLVLVLHRVAWPAQIPAACLPWIPWLPVLLLLWPLKRHLVNRLTKTTILDSQLRYEMGLLGRTTRTIMLPRVQDVTVHQSFTQRLFVVGDVHIETAGEAGRLTIAEIDRPQKVADLINERSQRENVTNPSL